MIWLTWRQHRLEALWAAVLTGLLAGSIAFLAHEVAIAAADCPGAGVGFCLPADALGQLAGRIARFNLAQYGLVVLPALAGAFIGAPLVAREIENGTQRLAWTQGVTRMRWIVVKLLFIVVPLLLAATVVGVLEIVFLNVQGPLVNRWAVFDQQAPLVVAATLFSVAVGVAFGSVVRRAVPAMAFTLVTFVVVRIGIAEFARPLFMPPVRFLTHDLSKLDLQANPTAWWLGNPDFYDATGHSLGSGGPQGIIGRPAYVIQYFQPGDRFWAFQTIESAILTGLAIVIIGFAIYWVTRRAA